MSKFERWFRDPSVRRSIVAIVLGLSAVGVMLPVIYAIRSLVSETPTLGNVVVPLLSAFVWFAIGLAALRWQKPAD
jgi:preprotein translocase subunit SecD